MTMQIGFSQVGDFSGGFVTSWGPQSKILKYQQKNDTLYVYIQEWSNTVYGCLVNNCNDDHSQTINYRIPFYA